MNKRKLFLLSVTIIAVALLVYVVVARSESGDKAKSTMSEGHQHDPAENQKPKILYYVDPMHPSYKSDKPGIAPDCGMQLTPVYADEESSGGPSKPGTVRLSPRKQQLINVKIGEVTGRHLTQSIHTVGVLQYDETKVAKIHSKIEGWIDRVFVDYTGRYVRKGQALFSIYSPELVATQQEYLLALKAEESLGKSQFMDVSSGAQSLKASARQRLKLWDVSDQQIRRLEETGKPMTDITFYSPVSGFVMERNVYEKQRITYETETYSIADLSTIWLMADIYEYEAAGIHAGQNAVMTLSYEPNRKLNGKVAYVYPELNNMTRTLKARIEFPNSDFQLKPGMYANVELESGHQMGLTVPSDAVLDSGTRKIVFVQKKEGEFEPREVQVGGRFGDDLLITGGLIAGEKIVVSGNFLIDSESQLKAALESMGSMDHSNVP